MRAGVLARKGVLSTDPSVDKLTDVGWVYEMEALRAYEAQRHEYIEQLIDLAVYKTRRMIIETFGFYMRRSTPKLTRDNRGQLVGPDGKVLTEEEALAHDSQASPDASTDIMDMFVPGVYLMGNPDMFNQTQIAVDKMRIAQEATHDVSIDTLSARLASPDMEPLIEDALARAAIPNPQEIEALLDLAGVFAADISPAELRKKLFAENKK